MKKLALVVFLCILTLGFIFTGTFDTAIAAEKDKYGGILKWATSKSPRVFGDPVRIRAADQEAAGPALEFLVLEKRGLGEYVPLLATDWKMSADNKSLVLNLRKGVKFHDGTDFNADAVKFNLGLWLKAPGPVLQTMESIDVINDHSVRLNFSGYNSLIMNQLATEAYMVSPTAYEKAGAKWMGTHLVGTGPFKMKKYERDVVLSFEKNKEYWRKGRPYLDGYDFIIIKDSMTQIAALKAGEIHGTRVGNREVVPGLVKSGFQLIKEDGPSVGLYGDSIHPDSVWANRKVREAIEYAIDKDTIMNDLGLGFPKVLYQAVADDNIMFNPDLKPRKFNPEKAKQLLKEAGYPNGFKTTITHMAAHWPESWVAMQSYLADVGIDVKLIPVDRPKYLKIRFEGALKNGASHVLMGQISANFAAGMSQDLLTSAKNAPDMLRPKGFDDLVDKVIVEPDAAKRKGMLAEASKMLYEDVSYIPINQEVRLNVFSPALKDFNPGTYAIPIMDVLTNSWLEK